MWRILKVRSIGGFTNVWMSVKLIYFDYDFYIYTYKYLEKRQKKIDFDELPKKNSKIKITKKKNY